jgi:hypothetical protein
VRTLEETIDHFLELNEKYPRPLPSGKCGLYIEIKCADYYINERKIDVNDMLLKVLDKYGIET